MFSLFFLPDIVIGLATLAVVLVLLDKTTGRILTHLDTLRTLATKTGFDVISVWKASQTAEIDTDRQKVLADFEERTLSQIDSSTAIEMLKQHRDEMRMLK